MALGFAKKIGMTRLFVGGKTVAVTALQFQPSFVLQLKTEQKDGYKAVQIGSVYRSKGSKAKIGHVQKYSGLEHDLRLIGEFDIKHMSEDKKEFGIADFAENDLLDITGETIGRGFTGAVKRWGFHGQPASHGHDHLKAVGSMGSRWPQRVTKGKKMAGHLGATNLTMKKVKVVAIDTENNLIFVNGSMPGANSHYLKIQKVS